MIQVSDKLDRIRDIFEQKDNRNIRMTVEDEMARTVGGPLPPRYRRHCHPVLVFAILHHRRHLPPFVSAVV